MDIHTCFELVWTLWDFVCHFVNPVFIYELSHILCRILTCRIQSHFVLVCVFEQVLGVVEPSPFEPLWNIWDLLGYVHHLASANKTDTKNIDGGESLQGHGPRLFCILKLYRWCCCWKYSNPPPPSFNSSSLNSDVCLSSLLVTARLMRPTNCLRSNNGRCCKT